MLSPRASKRSLLLIGVLGILLFWIAEASASTGYHYRRSLPGIYIPLTCVGLPMTFALGLMGFPLCFAITARMFANTIEGSWRASAPRSRNLRLVSAAVLTVTLVVLIDRVPRCLRCHRLVKLIESGDVGGVRRLLRKKVDLNALDTMFHAPLTVAAWEGHADIVELLLDRGAWIDRSFGTGSPPLHYAALEGHDHVVKMLIQRGADVNAKNKLVGKTALQWAAGAGRKNAAELLIAAGADVDAKARSGGATALHMAAEKGHREVVQLLITEGADVNAQTHDGQTPLDWATEKYGIVDILREHGGKSGKELKDEGD